MKCSLVVPAIPTDIVVFINNIDLLFQYLPIYEIVVIGPEVMREVLPVDGRLKFIEENSIIPFQRIKDIFSKKGTDLRRAGWYYQQFLKMEYARICKDQYYLLWDSDTLPLKKTEMFDDTESPYFDLKTEYNKAYFETLNNLIPGLKKSIKGSFISEHMVINSKYMKDLLEEIEENRTLQGQYFYEKILDSINERNISVGFSEFETYGTYVYCRYPSAFKERKWKSMRYGGFFYNRSSQIKQESIYWLSRHYNALSIEKTHNMSKWSKIVNKSVFMFLMPSFSLEFISFLLRIKNKILR